MAPNTNITENEQKSDSSENSNDSVRRDNITAASKPERDAADAAMAAKTTAAPAKAKNFTPWKKSDPAALVPDRLEGEWAGAGFVRDGQPIRVLATFKRNDARSGDIGEVTIASSRLNAVYRLVRDPNGTVRLADKTSDTRGIHPVRQSDSRDSLDRPYVTLGLPGYHTVVIYPPWSPSGGTVTRFNEHCGLIDPWLQARASAWASARELKIRFSDGLQTYDAAKAAAVESFAEPAFSQRFGTSFVAMSDEQRADFLLEVRDCVLTGDALLREELYEGLFQYRYLVRDRILFAGGFFQGSRPPPFDPREASRLSVEASRHSAEAEVRFSQTASAASAAATAAKAEEAIKAFGDDLSLLRPSFLHAALRPAQERIAALRDAEGAQRIAARRDRFRQRMEGTPFPPHAFLPSRVDRVRAVVTGDVQRLEGGDMSFFGGVIAESVEACKLPSSAVERLALVRLLEASFNLALMGDAFSSKNIGEAIGGSAQSQAMFLEGVTAVRTMGCAHPFLSVLLTTLVDISTAPAGNAEGGGPDQFVRTCSLDRSRLQCECIVREGSVLVPNIAQQRFDRSILSNIVSRNPLIGMNLFIKCGVSNY
ncbi:hypothetical protein [Nitrobacter winogradskyi]|uniref:Uncharacterized protein n=2 Tax=Nitrobacter winogradskyi TaxID=913 RepID=A0ACC6AK63_NITWI|nr:hypothetical protein [Nitrobacter winogradskyi]MCP2000001.1 hypothetical protein [Nitrobacter winogradskyi]GEC16623.1 hypothetical protein NWI01_25150 [Nitrobacter winogradskyi]